MPSDNSHGFGEIPMRFGFLTVKQKKPGIRDVRNLIRIRPRVGVEEVRQRMKDERRRIPGSVRAWAERRSA